MEVCEGDYRTNHDDIVINGDCPLCDALNTIEELEKQIEGLETDVENLQDEVYELTDKLAELEESNDT